MDEDTGRSLKFLSRSEVQLSDEDLEFVAQNVKKLSVMEMAQKLGKSQYMVHRAVVRGSLRVIDAQDDVVCIESSTDSGSGIAPDGFNSGHRMMFEKRFPGWSAEDVERAKRLAGRLPNVTIGKILEQSTASVCSMLRSHGIRNSYSSWSFEELAYLRDHCSSMTVGQLSDSLERSADQIRGICSKRGYPYLLEQDLRTKKRKKRGPNWGKRWTQEEDAQIRDLATSKTTREIARIVGRTVSAVEDRFCRLGVVREGAVIREHFQFRRMLRHGKWTKTQLDVLTREWTNTSDKKIGEMLGKSISTVVVKRKELGLLRKVGRPNKQVKVDGADPVSRRVFGEDLDIDIEDMINFYGSM